MKQTEKICLLGCESRGTIAPEIYGHFAEHIGGVYYDGLWVGEDSDVENVHGFRKFIIEKFKAINELRGISNNKILNLLIADYVLEYERLLKKW